MPHRRKSLRFRSRCSNQINARLETLRNRQLIRKTFSRSWACKASRHAKETPSGVGPLFRAASLKTTHHSKLTNRCLGKQCKASRQLSYQCLQQHLSRELHQIVSKQHKSLWISCSKTCGRRRLALTLQPKCKQVCAIITTRPSLTKIELWLVQHQAQRPDSQFKKLCLIIWLWLHPWRSLSVPTAASKKVQRLLRER